MRSLICVVLVFLVLAAVGSSSVSAASSKNIPSTWPKCKMDDPQIGECLRASTQIVLAELSDKGVRELGVLPADPLHLTHLHIGQGSGPISLQLDFFDLDVIGFKHLRLPKPFEVQLNDSFRMQAPLVFDKTLTLKGLYKSSGQLLVLPVNGDGHCEVDMGAYAVYGDFPPEGVTGAFDIRGHYFNKNGVKYVEITNSGFTFDVTRARMRFENLAKGKKEFSANLNRIINENWSAIIEDLKPAIQEAFGLAFSDLLNRIFLKVPFDKMWA